MGRHHRSALDYKQQLQHAATDTVPCAICGNRLGKHRFGTDQCPNARWSAGNGGPQWREHACYTEPDFIKLTPREQQ